MDKCEIDQGEVAEADKDYAEVEGGDWGGPYGTGRHSDIESGC